MSIAAIISLCAAALQLGMGLLLVGLARAPGWRAARTFALIALTAAAYSAADIIFALPTASDATVLIASRINYCVGSLHAVAWLLYTFGGPTASPRFMPLPAKILATVLTVVGIGILLTGAHSRPGEWQDVRVEWAQVQYHTPLVYAWAEWYALLVLAALAIPFIMYFPRTLRREPGARAHLVGFTIYFACMSVEVLVTNGVISTFYLGDIGFLAVVVPVAVATVRRVVSDAGKLDSLSRRLAGEVEERTVALDRVQDALVESERHAALGRLAAGVGHEINNPLTYLMLSLEEVDKWSMNHTLPAEVRESLTNARDGTERIRQVVDGLRTYTRATAGEFRILALDAIARSALRVAAHHVQHVARLVVDLEPTAPVLGDEPQLVQVVVNLITNSAQAIGEAKLNRDVSISVRTFTLADGRVVLEVGDTGPGIPASDLGRLTEPYFTTRAHAGGTGLGLFLSRGMIESHLGQLEVESTIGIGTVTRVILPAADSATFDSPDPTDVLFSEVDIAGEHASHARLIADGTTAAVLTAPTVTTTAAALVPAGDATFAHSAVSAGGAIASGAIATSAVAASAVVTSTIDKSAEVEVAIRRRVLLIDDEPLVTRVMARALSAHCDVLIAESGARALEVLGAGAAEASTFDVVLCDIMMPGMTGIEFEEILRVRHPALRRRTLFLTGGAVTATAGEFLDRDDVHYLSKPVTTARLVEAIEEAARLA